MLDTTLPKIDVASRAELARVLREQRDLLVARARSQLGDIPEVDAAVRRAVATLLNVGDPHVRHVLHRAVLLVDEECASLRQLPATAAPGSAEAAEVGEDVLVDPIVGAIVGPKAEAMKRLSAGERRALELACEGLQPIDIAAALDISHRAATMRLYRARRSVRESPKAGPRPLPGFVAVLVSRFRARVTRRLSDAQAHLASTGSLIGGTSQIVLPLIVAGGIGMNSATSQAPQTAELRALASSASVEALGTGGAVGDPVGSAASGTASLPSKDLRERLVSSQPPRLVPDRLPDAETPDDSRVISFAPSPNYARDRTIVALALGNGCGCPMLFRSTDGGATWQGTLQAATGTQVLLPPAFPTDPRIFIGQDAPATLPDSVSAGWGKPFLPLPLPPGRLAVVGNRVLSAATGGVWSLEDGVISPVVAYQGVGVAAVASTAGAAYIFTPAHAVVPGPAVTTGPSMLACTPDCRFTGSVPLGDVGLLSASGTKVVAAAGDRIAVSDDGGAIFREVSARGGQAVLSVAAANGDLWSVLNAPRPTAQRWAGAGWTGIAVSSDRNVQTLVAIAGERLFAVLAGGGFLCSTDAGDTWAARCPPEKPMP